MNFNIHWPRDPDGENDLVPWYAIIRRCVFYPIYELGMNVACLALFCGWGSEEAARFYEENH